MVEEKPITKKDLVEVLGTFADDVLLPGIDKLIDRKLNDNFNEKIKPEIMRSEQASRDWTSKEVGRAEGRVISKINILANVLNNKNIIDEEEMAMVKKSGLI